jgi:hypothetical protein
MPEINRIIFGLLDLELAIAFSYVPDFTLFRFSENQDAVYALFMKAHKCYDLIPTSSKLVVFDTQLPVRNFHFINRRRRF